jgi:hypothetical protein
MQEGARSERLLYQNEGLVVDLGAGLWAQPLPMDFDGDGDFDLLVATADVPSNGLYFFENPGGDETFPVFKPGVWLDEAFHNLTISYTEKGPVVMSPNSRYPDIETTFLKEPETIGHAGVDFKGRTRAKQWKLADYDGDGQDDLILALGVWADYGWDDAWDEEGNWKNGPLRGYVYVARNTGSNEEPVYGEPEQIMAGDGPVDTYGCPSPNFADFDGDGDLDLMAGEFMDRITWFENTGTRTEPKYAPGRFLTHEGKAIHMDLQMLQVVALDWDKDGDVDLVVGQEDGRVALMEHTGEVQDHMPVFASPRFFQQEADAVKVGALVTPSACDWDGDGDMDIVAGDTAGYLNFVENLDGGDPPKWAAPVYLKADGEVIRIQAGPKGSIQGPAEAKWGYTAPCVADWNHDGLLDIVINSIWGEILWYENHGTATAPALKAAQPIQVAWEGETPKPAWVWWTPKDKQLVTQWRTTPFVVDLNQDGLNDLVMLDTEGYLAFYERRKEGEALMLLPPQRIFKDGEGKPLRLNEGHAGKSGRRKFVLADWDGDGRLDLLLNSESVDLYRNTAEAKGEWRFEYLDRIDQRKLAGHTTSPTIVDWDKDGVPDLLTGGEDGFLYYLKNPRSRVK